jgi:Tfp pilus assembly protein PilO
MPADPAATRSRQMFIAGGYSLIVVTFVVVCLLPYFRNVSKIQADIASAQKEIATRQEKAKTLEDVRQRVQLVQLQVRKFDRLVPSNQDLGPFLEQLSRELYQAGLKDISVRNLAVDALGKSQKLPIEVGGTGTFDQFHRFLIHLENLPRMSSVEKLSIESDTPMQGDVHVQLTLNIYNTNPA